MINHVTHVFTDMAVLRATINAEEIARLAESSSGQLVQIYCASNTQGQLADIASLISDCLPQAVIAGATTVGEVAHGRLMTGQTVIGFTFFESSQVTSVAMSCTGADAHQVGAEIGRRAKKAAANIAGVLLLSTPLSIDASALLAGLQSTLGGHPVFGGGAGDYGAMKNSSVFCGDKQFEQGAVAVVFSGAELHLDTQTYLGWRPLSRPMRITKVDGLRVMLVDDLPAFEVYRRYLNIQDNESFFLNALEFPFLLERDGGLMARVPIAVDQQGGLQFVADIHEGETFRIGYGDMDLVVENSKKLHDAMTQFSPEVIFLYTCGCRRFLMQENVELETQPFEKTAPTFGFYTYGEFFGSSNLSLLNSTMVVAGMREGEGKARKVHAGLENHSEDALSQPDPYANKHARVMSRLLRFIDTVTSELESSIQEVTKLSITDRLTKLVNRMRLDQVLEEQLKLASRYGTPFSAILLDVDEFKQVNDLHGHVIGDEVLVHVANLLASNTRSVDIVGRWGGEEFLIVAPNTLIDEAALLAEKLRRVLESAEFSHIGRKTASFGLATYRQGDSVEQIVARADAALYEAKRAGRNNVKIG